MIFTDTLYIIPMNPNIVVVACGWMPLKIRCLLGEDLSVDSSSQGGYIIYVESLLDGSPAQRSGRYMPGASSLALNALTAPAWVRVPDQIMHDWLISDSPFVSITNLFECVWMQDP